MSPRLTCSACGTDRFIRTYDGVEWLCFSCGLHMREQETADFWLTVANAIDAALGDK